MDSDGKWEQDKEYSKYLESRRKYEEDYFKEQNANDALKGFTIKDHRTVSDPIVQNVIDKFRTRHFVGMKTYGMTMAANPADTLEWINHTQDELMDAILYLERLKKEIK